MKGSLAGLELKLRDVLVAAVLLLGLGLYIVGQLEPYTWVVRDGRFYIDSNETLLHDFTYEEAFARSWYEENLGWNYNMPPDFSNVAQGARGELYHFRPWILPVLGMPLYFAFGLYGALLFNLLCYFVIAGGGYVFASRFAGRRYAALVVPLWLLGTTMVETLYDYSVDALLVAFFVLALEAMFRKRGGLAGACVAATLIIKPTTILYIPAVTALLFELPREERKRVFVNAIYGGAAVLIVAALVNWWMYGAPWVFGYMRAVHMVRGEMALASTGDRFNTPLMDGLQRTFVGGYGFGHFYGVFAPVVLGLWPMLRRHLAVTLGTLVSVVAALALFSIYDFDSDRFQYPSFALLLPFLAWGFRGIVERVRRIPKVPLVFALAALVVSLAHQARNLRPHPWRAQVGLAELRSRVVPPHTQTAIDLVREHGTLDLRGRIGMPHGRGSPISIGRSGAWLPRGNLLVVGATAMAGSLSFLLHALLAALGFGLLGFATRGIAPAPARLALLAAALSLHPVREMVAYGGPSAFAFVGLAAAFAALRAERFAWAFCGAVFAAFVLAEPLILVPFAIPLALAVVQGESRRALIAPAVVLGVWIVFDLVVYGRPFDGPEGFVLIGGERYFVTPEQRLSDLALAGHPARATALVLLLGITGAALHARRERWIGGLAACVGLFVFLASGHGQGIPQTAYVAVLWPFILVPFREGFELLQSAVTWTRRKSMIGVIGTVLALLVIGSVWRVAQAQPPLRLESNYAVRWATVHLGDAPCDFLTWEHMSWECATMDGDATGRTGIQLPRASTVRGERMRLFVVPSARRGRRVRKVEFEPTDASKLELRWIVPDIYTTSASMRITWGEQVLVEEEVAPGADWREQSFDLEGEGPLRIEVQSPTMQLTGVGFSGSLD